MSEEIRQGIYFNEQIYNLRFEFLQSLLPHYVIFPPPKPSSATTLPMRCLRPLSMYAENTFCKAVAVILLLHDPSF